jgi:hypothetical protein
VKCSAIAFFFTAQYKDCSTACGDEGSIALAKGRQLDSKWFEV